jgi:hypothetical protein
MAVPQIQQKFRLEQKQKMRQQQKDERLESESLLVPAPVVLGMSESELDVKSEKENNASKETAAFAEKEEESDNDLVVFTFDDCCEKSRVLMFPSTTPPMTRSVENLVTLIRQDEVDKSFRRRNFPFENNDKNLSQDEIEKSFIRKFVLGWFNSTTTLENISSAKYFSPYIASEVIKPNEWYESFATPYNQKKRV